MADDYTVNEARIVTKDYYHSIHTRDRYVYDYVGAGDHTRSSVSCNHYHGKIKTVGEFYIVAILALTNGGLEQDITLSQNPDFTSLLRVGDKIFSITHYESPRPGVAYLTELEQDKSTGKLSVAQHLSRPCNAPLSVSSCGAYGTTALARV